MAGSKSLKRKAMTHYVELVNRHSEDHYSWLDNGVPAEGPIVKLKPALNRGGRTGKRALEYEHRWPEYLEWLASGQSRADYARAVGVATRSLYHWERARPGRIQEVKDAISQGADLLIDQATWVIRTSPAERDCLKRAEMLAFHLRWRAERMSVMYGSVQMPEDSAETTIRVVRQKLPTAAERKASMASDGSGPSAERKAEPETA